MSIQFRQHHFAGFLGELGMTADLAYVEDGVELHATVTGTVPEQKAEDEEAEASIIRTFVDLHAKERYRTVVLDVRGLKQTDGAGLAALRELLGLGEKARIVGGNAFLQCELASVQ